MQSELTRSGLSVSVMACSSCVLLDVRSYTRRTGGSDLVRSSKFVSFLFLSMFLFLLIAG